jgi:DNA segregation ATPase FtsK/SpoIIIE-like protein
MPDESREEQIERKIDREVAGAVALASHPSGAVTIAPKNMTELMEFAKLMAVSGPCVRAAFRGNPGACLAIAMQAFKWAADPFAVCNKAYITTNKSGETQISYEAQLIHSIVNTRAPLQRRLRASYTGEGVKRACKVVGWLQGEDEPFEYQSPRIEQIAVKNSPLWTADPDQQLFYYSTRAWARRTVPEILLGIYTPEEAQGQIIDVDATEIGERPRREDFTSNEDAKSYNASEEHEESEEEPAEEEESEEEEPEAAEPYVVIGAHGNEQQFDTAEAAAEACHDAIEEAATARADLGVAACWENNAALVYELRERGRDDLADELGRFYAEQLAAADRPEAKSAPAATTVAPEKKAPAEPPEEPTIDVVKPQRRSEKGGWNWPLYAEEVIVAGRRLRPERVGEFRVKNASMLNNLRIANKEEWSRIQQALAEHEREGTAA